jgi:peroxiredoxin Q/BCP
MKLKVGQKAPEFSLPDKDEKIHNLSDYLGKWVLVYFYPTDDTPGCTTEACGFRDNLPHFENLSVEIIGISVQDEKSHAKFAKKYNLPFTLLADKNKEVVNLYGVWAPKKLFGREFLGTRRTSFLINPEGTIVKIYENVRPPKHPTHVLEDLKSLKVA